MDTKLYLSPANSSYLSKTEPINGNQNLHIENSNIVIKKRKSAFVFFAIALLSIISGYFGKKYIINSPSNIKFKNGIATNFITNQKFSGEYSFSNKNGDYTFIFQNGKIQKSIKRGKDCFVKEYKYNNQNNLSSVIVNNQIFDIENIKTKIQEKFNNISLLKEKLKNISLNYSFLKDASEPKNEEEIIQQLSMQIDYIKTKLELNKIENNLDKKQKHILIHQLEKLQKARVYCLDALNKNLSVAKQNENIIQQAKVA